MTDDSGAAFEKFVSTGRIGRRNALPDILDEKHTNVGTCEISDSLTKLNCRGKCIGKTNQAYYAVLLMYVRA